MEGLNFVPYLGSQWFFKAFSVEISTDQVCHFNSAFHNIGFLGDIFLRGYAGWNSRRALRVLDQVFPKDAAVQPSLVIVYLGGNDSMHPHPTGLGPHVPLPEYIENMRTIAIHLKSLSVKTRVIFLSAPPVNEAKIREFTGNKFDALGRTNDACQKYSDALIELCQELDVKAVDLWNALQKRDDWLTACFTDGIHLSSEGSKIVVEEILSVLKEADWEPSLHWKSLPTEFSEDSPYDLVGSDGGSWHPQLRLYKDKN
ncbi:GDSL esterase/lipase CPRD49-like isoform X3 [Camellia sinensis]|uniref:GDSL esterase/lipase CPRD49-like isoform X3 n=1 Tax=Camellia sinensis TaxID=4442 RepID=UPI001035C3AF|nr:GDSL esterase/lipase CPRD49-like isoform X3 [Camellia sinensis]